jgi:hypothetical protein
VILRTTFWTKSDYIRYHHLEMIHDLELKVDEKSLHIICHHPLPHKTKLSRDLLLLVQLVDRRLEEPFEPPPACFTVAQRFELEFTMAFYEFVSRVIKILGVTKEDDQLHLRSFL